MTELFARVANVTTSPTPQGALQVLQLGLGDVLVLVLPIAGCFAAIGILVDAARNPAACSHWRPPRPSSTGSIRSPD